MTRDEFLKTLLAAGIGSAALPSLFLSCQKDDLNVTFDGRVIIIGAGAAGLMAGHLLHQYGIDFTILEATDRFGGRVKKDTTLADFPIDLGAEWIHSKPDIFSELIRNDNTTGTIDLIPYNPTDFQTWIDGSLSTFNTAGLVYGEYKFKNTTWYDFFADYIVPDFEDKIIYNFPVHQIDYSAGQVVVSDENNVTLFQADKVLVTVPVNVLKSGMISFAPDLPQNKWNALQDADMPDGIKVFMEFSERFYPDLLSYESLTGNNGDGELLYYDAAFKKDSNRHILALFCVGSNATQYTSLTDDQAIMDYVLSQLDEVFEGKASQTLLNSVVQNWSAAPYTLGSYTSFGNHSQSTEDLLAPVDQKIYFAGEATADNAQSTVHGAGLNAMEVIEGILTGG